MPWPLAALLIAGGIALVIKAIIDRNTRYDEPANLLDDRFDHMMEPSSVGDRLLRDRRRR